jgi:excisionase family DNA binding protein
MSVTPSRVPWRTTGRLEALPSSVRARSWPQAVHEFPVGEATAGQHSVFTVKEAAAMARVSPTTIRRWCRSGHMSAFQVGPGSAIRIPANQLRDLLARLAEDPE